MHNVKIQTYMLLLCQLQPWPLKHDKNQIIHTIQSDNFYTLIFFLFQYFQTFFWDDLRATGSSGSTFGFFGPNSSSDDSSEDSSSSDGMGDSFNLYCIRNLHFFEPFWFWVRSFFSGTKCKSCCSIPKFWHWLLIYTLRIWPPKSEKASHYHL